MPAHAESAKDYTKISSVGEPGGVPIPVVPSLLAAGALAAHAGTGVLMPVLVTVSAALVADLLWYGLGRWRGRQALAVVGRLSRRRPRTLTTPSDASARISSAFSSAAGSFQS